MWKETKRKRIAQEVAHQLRGLILRGSYKVGDKLPPERKLAEELGVNRATLREALKNLEQMGLVGIRQGDGTRVLDFLHTAGLDLLAHLLPVGAEKHRDIIRDIMEFRQIVGKELARLAARRAAGQDLELLKAIAQRAVDTPEELLYQDLDFYCELSRIANNLVFILLLNSVRRALRSCGWLFADVNPPRQEVQEHHQRLMAALEAGDEKEAGRAADQHLQRGLAHLMEKLNSGPEVIAANSPESAPASGDESNAAQPQEPPALSSAPVQGRN